MKRVKSKNPSATPLSELNTDAITQRPNASHSTSDCGASIEPPTQSIHSDQPSKPSTHFGYRQVEVDEKQGLVKEVFESVAPKYDLMNDLMSLGIHRLWKRHAIDTLHVLDNMRILDLAGGTGDLTNLILNKKRNNTQVVLGDINLGMLKEGKSRLIDKGHVGLPIIGLNAQSLPFKSNSFDRVIIAFGLRNVTHKDLALASILRVLKPGGKLVILEFSQPIHAPLRKIYDMYSFSILPKLGKVFANDEDSYRYLAESIRMHPNQESLRQMMMDVGFGQCRYHNLSQGIVAVHTGYKIL